VSSGGGVGFLNSGELLKGSGFRKSKKIDQFRIISLLWIEAKIFFSAVSNRLSTFLSKNKFIDTSVQTYILIRYHQITVFCFTVISETNTLLIASVISSTACGINQDELV